MPDLKSAHQTRYERYQELRREFSAEEEKLGLPHLGTQARFAQRIDVNPKYVGHVQTKHRQIGDALARKMEATFGKPANWMDSFAPAKSAIRSKRTDIQVIITELAEEAASIDPIATHRALLAIVQHARAA